MGWVGLAGQPASFGSPVASGTCCSLTLQTLLTHRPGAKVLCPKAQVKPWLWLSPSPKGVEPQLTSLPSTLLAWDPVSLRVPDPHPVQSLPSARPAASPEKAKEAQAVLDCDHDHVPIGGQGRPIVGDGGASHERAPVEPHHDLQRQP